MICLFTLFYILKLMTMSKFTSVSGLYCATSCSYMLAVFVLNFMLGRFLLPKATHCGRKQYNDGGENDLK